MFLGAINTTKDQKDAQYICNALVEYIQNVGVDNVVQICTNNICNPSLGLVTKAKGVARLRAKRKPRSHITYSQECKKV